MSHSRPTNLSTQEALQKLLEGNNRYTHHNLSHPNLNKARRDELVAGQSPFAIILTCADSRVCPEHIFDVGLGDIFTIRVAGNIVDKAVLGSIEYAAVHLGVNLVIVMGHESCGAVGAAIAGSQKDLHIDELIEAITPAIASIEGNKAEKVNECVQENAKFVAQQIRSSEAVMKSLAEHGVEVISAYYRLNDSRVEIL